MEDLMKKIDNKYTLTEVIAKRARTKRKEINDRIKKAEKEKEQELVYELNDDINSIGYSSIEKAIEDFREDEFSYKFEE